MADKKPSPKPRRNKSEDAPKKAKSKVAKTKGKAPKDKPRPKAQNLEADHGALDKPKGMTIGVKFLFFILLALTLAVGVSTAKSLDNTLKIVSRDINYRGHAMLSALQAIPREQWLNWHEQGLEGEGKWSDEIIRRALQEVNGTHDDFHSILVNDNQRALIAGQPAQVREKSDRTEEGVTYADGVLLSSQTPVRSYKGALLDESGGVSGEIVVVLRATALEEARQQSYVNAGVAAGVALLIGVVIALFLARKVTRPVRILLRDMNIVRRGNLNHVTQPHSRDEMGLLSTNFNAMTKALQVAHQAELEKKALEHDMKLAHDIQTSLIPAAAPDLPGCDVHAFYSSAKEVGGDYFDFIRVDKDHIGMVVADVSGKGVQGSMIMAMTRGIMKTVAPGCLSARETLARLNHSLAQDLKPGSFVTSLYLIFNMQTKVATIASAGHNPLFLLQSAKKMRAEVNPPGIALGFDKGTVFNRIIQEKKFQMHPGDIAVLYTDGVVEAMSPEREEYGSERFYRFVVSHANKNMKSLVDDLVLDLEDHKGTGPQHDDITVVALKVNA